VYVAVVVVLVTGFICRKSQLAERRPLEKQAIATQMKVSTSLLSVLWNQVLRPLLIPCEIPQLFAVQLAF
jgi:hypothetical protein